MPTYERGRSDLDNLDPYGSKLASLKPAVNRGIDEIEAEDEPTWVLIS